MVLEGKAGIDGPTAAPLNPPLKVPVWFDDYMRSTKASLTSTKRPTVTWRAFAGKRVGCTLAAEGPATEEIGAGWALKMGSCSLGC